ncbi:hypothetical protein JKY72_06790 [Candidatus Gracilibacteria bacterium]|nr:hypothetical protein [Candidatus Gracilibacteria bacterium]
MLEQHVYDPDAVVIDLSRRLDRGDTSHIRIENPVEGDPIPDALLSRLDHLFDGNSAPSDIGGLTLKTGAIAEEKKGEIVDCLRSLLDAGAEISVQSNP